MKSIKYKRNLTLRYSSHFVLCSYAFLEFIVNMKANMVKSKTWMTVGADVHVVYNVSH